MNLFHHAGLAEHVILPNSVLAGLMAMLAGLWLFPNIKWSTCGEVLAAVLLTFLAYLAQAKLAEYTLKMPAKTFMNYREYHHLA